MAEYKQPQNVPTPNISFDTDPNTLKAGDLDKCCGTPRVSMGDPGRNKVKTDGIKVRGTGAAVRGVTARGPMA
jgi:hypothetical protein